MSVQNVVTLICDMSGRQDMARTGSVAQAKLIAYINAASRMLDREVWNFKRSKAVKLIKLYPGMYFVTFEYARSIDEVWVANADGLTELDITSYSLRRMRSELYGQEPANIVSRDGTITVDGDGNVTGTDTQVDTDGVVSGDIMVMPNVNGGTWTLIDTVVSDTEWSVTDMDGEAYSGGAQASAQYFYILNAGAIERGTPTYGAINIIRVAPGTSRPLPLYDSVDLVDDNDLRDGILLYPPPDQEYTLRLEGDFYSGELSALTDSNYWTEVDDGMVLAFRTMQLMEGILRNMTGAKGYKIELQDMVDGIKRNFIAQRSATIGRRQRRIGR